MIRKNQRRLNDFNAFSDGVLVLISYQISSWLWLDVIQQSRNIAGQKNMVWVSAAYAAWMVFVLNMLKVYRTTRIKKRGTELRSICLGSVFSILTAAAALYLLRLPNFSRGVLLLFYLLSTLALLGKRFLLRYILRQIRRKGHNLKHILVVGGGRLAERYIQIVTDEETLGIRIREQLIPGEDIAQQLEKRLRGADVDEVILALAPNEMHVIVPAIHQCEKSGVKVSVIPFYNDVIPTHPTVDAVGDIKLIQLRTTPLDEPINRFVKRSFDVVVSLILLLVLSPVMLALAICIRFSGTKSVLFIQERIGLHKKPFRMLKFRTMQINDEQDIAWSTSADQRRTAIGVLLRKTSLDELPQLYNVLRGDMSLVGPRPEIPHFVKKFQQTIPLYMVRSQVKPGMTGWAQVNGFRGDTSIPDRIRHDLWYIENWSFGLDITILFRTLFGGMLNQERLHS